MSANAATPLNRDATLVVVVDRAAETAVILFYPNGDTEDPIFIATNGSLEDLEHLKWLVSSAATFHHIPFQVDEE